MGSFGDKEMALARVYGRAMLELAQAQGQAQSLGEELSELAGLLDRDPQLDTFFSTPMVDSDARRTMIEKSMRGRASELLVSSLQVINRKGRLPILRAINRAYELLLEELQGRVEVQVRTPVALTEGLREKLRGAVAAYTGKTPDLIETVDEDLIGGMVLQIQDEKIDMTVSARLARLSRTLADRASREIHGETSYVEGALA